MSIADANERYFASLINASRKDKGLAGLKLEKRLNDSADAHSHWMLATDTFSHTGQGGSSPRQRMEKAGFDLAGQWMTAENIAYVSIRGESDLRDEIRQLHQNLLNSPGHYANIMGSASYLGIGLEVGAMTVGGRDYRVLMVTQNYADTDGKVNLDTGKFGQIAQPVVSGAVPLKVNWQKTFDGVAFTVAANGTAANDDYRLGNGNDSVRAGAGNDWVQSGGGSDRIWGDAGADRLAGDAGADYLYGGLGNDTLLGGGDNDRIAGQDGNDLLRGDAGLDLMWGGTGNDRLFAGADMDVLNGEAGNDWLAGEAGNDTLLGGDGNDTLTGGTGNDLLNGGAGIDSFVFARGCGSDMIQAYEKGRDRLLIDADLLDANSAAFVRDHMKQTTAGVVIDFGGGDRIVVAGANVTISSVADDILAY